MRHNVAHRKLGRVTRASHALLRNQAMALHPPRADRNHRAKGEGTAAVRRAADHHRQARQGGRQRRGARRSPRDGWCSPTFRTRTSSRSCSTPSRRASPSVRAATPACCASGSDAGTRPKSRSSSWSAASTTPREEEEGAGRGRRAEEDQERRRAPRVRPRSAFVAARAGRLEGSGRRPDQGRPQKTTTPRKAGGS